MLAVSACSSKTSNDNNENNANNTSSNSSNQNNVDETNEKDNEGNNAIESSSEEDEYKFADGETISIYLGMNAETAQGMSSFEEHPVVKEIEKRTGLNLTFISPPQNDDGTFFNMTVASQDWPDLWAVNWTKYPGGVDAAIDDGLLIDINEYVEEYAPNFMEKLNSLDEVTQKNFMNDSGIIVKLGVPMDCEILDGVQHTGPVVRGDVLNEIGMDLPKDLSEFTDMLYALKDAGFETPLGLYKFSDYQAWNSSFIAGAFGINLGVKQSFADAFILDDDGNAVFSMTQNGFKEYLTYLNQLYNDGIIDRNFVNRTESDTKKLMYTGTVATMAIGNWEVIEMNQLGQLEEETFEIVGYELPRKEADAEYILGNTREQGNDNNEGWQISTTCEYPELATKFIDYLYSDDGIILANYGPEEVDGEQIWNLEDGHYNFTDFIFNNSETPFNTIRNWYTIQGFQTYFHDDYQELQYSDQHQHDNWEQWTYNVNNSGHTPQAISLTADESTETVNIMNQITTYVEEMTYKFILGEEDLEDFDSFVDTIYGMDVELVEKIYSEATARYYAR